MSNKGDDGDSTTKGYLFSEGNSMKDKKTDADFSKVQKNIDFAKVGRVVIVVLCDILACFVSVFGWVCELLLRHLKGHVK